MPYIGNTVQNQGFAPAIDYFSGNGVTVTFTLSRPIASVAQIICAIDNVIQNPSSAFTVSGNSITFTSAPLSGTNNIWVEYTSLITTYAAISQDPSVIGDITASGGYLSTGDFGNSYIDGIVVDYVTGNARLTTGPLDDMTFYHGGTASRSAMMDLYYAGGAKIYGTTALTIPVGTTAERPGTPAAGMHRLNSTTGFAEYWTGSQWASYGNLSTTSVSYLIVAGGGGGGGSGPTGAKYGAGAGGAGGYLAGTQAVSVGTSYTVTVGAGGASGAAGGGQGGNGGNSLFTPVGTTAVGGGGGGWDTGPSGTNGSSGGSGGGGASSGGNGGSGTSGQGNAGGASGGGGGGGGGGASAAGGNASTNGAAGGGGTASSITGSSVTYAGGGGGGVYTSGTPGAGGSGGGGAGGALGNNGNAGTTNTGGGGGGASGNGGTTAGGAGGSGVVIIAYPSSYKDATATGTYTKTVSGGNTIYTFTGSGTISF